MVRRSDSPGKQARKAKMEKKKREKEKKNRLKKVEGNGGNNLRKHKNERRLSTPAK